MAEIMIEHVWAMIGVFAAFVGVVFGIRGGGHKSSVEGGEGS